LSHTAGRDIAAMVQAAGMFGYGQVLFSIDAEAWLGRAGTGEGGLNEMAGQTMNVLYINGHPLLNTRLLA